MKNIGLYVCLTKKNCQLKLSTRLEILLKVHHADSKICLHDRVHVKTIP